MGTVGYTPQALRLLAAMGRADRDRADELRPRIAEELTTPTRALVEALGAELQARVSPGLTADPRINGSISPHRRDLRFTRDRTYPLKDHLQVMFWEGERK